MLGILVNITQDRARTFEVFAIWILKNPDETFAKISFPVHFEMLLYKII